MSNNNLNESILDALKNFEKDTLRDNFKKALNILKEGNTEEIADKIRGACSKSSNGQTSLENSILDKINIDEDTIKKLNSNDLEKLLNYLGDHKDEIENKINDIVK